MTDIYLQCKNVRTPYGKKDDGSEEERVKKYIGPHYIANTVLALAGHLPVSLRYKLKGSDLLTDNDIYNQIVSGHISYSFTFDRPPTLDIITEFKCGSKDKDGEWAFRPTGAGKSGEYSEIWFHNVYRKSSGKNYSSDIIPNFKLWLRTRYNNEPLDSFRNLISLFVSDIVETAKKENVSPCDIATQVLPSEFHIFSFFVNNHDFYEKPSKYVTKPVFLKTDGGIVDTVACGSVVLTGGPVWMLNSNFALTLNINDETTYTKLYNSILKGKGFSSIGNGGLCELKKGDH